MSPCPLTYKRLLVRLRILEAELVRDEKNSCLIVFERGDGYFGHPRGKRYPLRIRPEGQLVPVAEIEKLLEHVGFDSNGFWQLAEGEHAADPVAIAPAPRPMLPTAAGIFQNHKQILKPVCDICHAPLSNSDQQVARRCATDPATKFAKATGTAFPSWRMVSVQEP